MLENSFGKLFLKPVRYPDDNGDFHSNVRSNWEGGRLTNVCFDLNILARISEIFGNPSSAEMHDLPELRQELALPGLILNPGFAYREMDPQKVLGNWEAFEHFVSSLSPAYRNTPDATWTPELSWSVGQADDAPPSFWALPEAKREYLIGFYIAQLLLRVGRKALGEPRTMLLAYLNDSYRLGGQFRSAQVLHYRTSLESDVWIVTQDRGMANFASTFCYSPDHRSSIGLYSAFMTLSPFPEMDTDPYWRETDATIDHFADAPRRTFELPYLETRARQIEEQLKHQLGG